MLDARTAILLEAVNFQCKTGTYQVVEERELMEYFPVPSGKVRPFVLLEITNYDDGNTPVLYGCIYVDTERIRLNIVRDIGQLS